MVEPQVLVQCAQRAAEHAARLKGLMGKVAIAGTAMRRVHDLEINAYTMEFEAKASLLRRWQGRSLAPPNRRITEPVMSNMPYLDARAVATHLHVVPKRAVRLASIWAHTGDSLSKSRSVKDIWPADSPLNLNDTSHRLALLWR
jgi:hypothetical protein